MITDFDISQQFTAPYFSKIEHQDRLAWQWLPHRLHKVSKYWDRTKCPSGWGYDAIPRGGGRGVGALRIYGGGWVFHPLCILALQMIHHNIRSANQNIRYLVSPWHKKVNITCDPQGKKLLEQHFPRWFHVALKHCQDVFKVSTFHDAPCGFNYVT